jgi:hypothetical protein
MPIDRVDSLQDVQDAPRHTIKAALSWEHEQERRLAAAQGQAAKHKKQQERQKKRDARNRSARLNGRSLRSNYSGKLAVRPINAWKLMSAVPAVKTDSEHIGVIGERLCLRVTVESTHSNEPVVAAVAEGDETVAVPDDNAKVADHTDVSMPAPKTAGWLVVLVTDNGDRIGYVAGEAEVAEHIADSAGRQQTMIKNAVLMPMVGQCVARSTVQKWSDSGPIFASSLDQTSQRRNSVSSRPSSASVRIGVSSSLLSVEQIKNPWGRGTAPRGAAGRERYRTADPRVAAQSPLRREGTRVRQEAVQAELSQHKLSSLLGILRQQGEDESTIAIILDDSRPQLAAAKRAAQPLDASLDGLTASRPSTAPTRRTRPWSAGSPWSAVVGGGFVVSGRSGLVNESECMELLQEERTVNRPRAGAVPRVQSSLAPRRHSLAISSLNQTNTGMGVSYISGGLTSQSVASLPTANLSLRQTLESERQVEARQRALESRAAASQLVSKRRSELTAWRLSELVKEMHAKSQGTRWQGQVDKLLDAADPKKAIVDALIALA